MTISLQIKRIGPVFEIDKNPFHTKLSRYRLFSNPTMTDLVLVNFFGKLPKIL